MRTLAIARNGLLAANLLLPLIAAGLFWQGAEAAPIRPAADTGGVGLVLLTAIRGY
jgi:hypothetical protein